MKPNENFNQGISEALREAQLRANTECRSIRVGNVWVNPSIAAMSKRSKDPIPSVFDTLPKPMRPRND